ncbi:Uncharacterised protein [Mycobacteroides abscessus subsp. abscessus]|nr:Uncharacterised protein [Mycobacteroides abscessus subsp. abscessus]
MEQVHVLPTQRLLRDAIGVLGPGDGVAQDEQAAALLADGGAGCAEGIVVIRHPSQLHGKLVCGSWNLVKGDPL